MELLADISVKEDLPVPEKKFLDSLNVSIITAKLPLSEKIVIQSSWDREIPWRLFPEE